MTEKQPTAAAEKVIVGLSGGVDSSVAALLLKEAGFTVEGAFMKNWEEDDDDEHCASAADMADAAAICAKLDIPLHKLNFAAEYWDEVFAYCLNEFRLGTTPNPDIFCNQKIKFGAFLDYVRGELGADWLATGHYARLTNDGGAMRLRKGADPNKDQSYFLHRLTTQQLEHVRFPLGELNKREVREIARCAGLVTHDKKDSTGICFIGERDFATFLKTYLPPDPGAIIDNEGHVLGQHDGLMYYTLGQRSKLGIGGVAGAADAPWYVTGKDLVNNRLIVAQGSVHPELYSTSLRLAEVHWVSGEQPALPVQLMAKCRYRQPDQPCLLTSYGDGFEVMFNEPQRAITPGQSVCFYDGDLCLGGGIILAATAATGYSVSSSS